MSDPSEDRSLFREAADLAIRLQNDPGNPVSAEMARNWAARSPQHQKAWARVAEIHGMTGRILTEQRGISERAGKVSRRTLIVGGAAGLSALAAGTWYFEGALRIAKADYRSATAEIRTVRLGDGSVITLGPESAIAVNYSTARRSVELLSGMGYFEVARDPARPFSVLAGELSATALGTAFDVSADAGFISVSVDHGIVEARSEGSRSDAGEKLNAGDWITLDPSTRGITRGNRDASQIAAWRTGLLIAERESVAAMIAKISRWQPGSVVIADPGLGGRMVSGVFDLSDPIRALEAVVRPFGARVRGIGAFMTVITPI
jgi:transmembrane sensor